MLISVVIFAFGCVISFIVFLGIMNARELRKNQLAVELKYDRQQSPLRASGNEKTASQLAEASFGECPTG